MSGLAVEPPDGSLAREGWLGLAVHLELGVVESVVLTALEEVSQSVLPAEGGIDAVGQADPILEGLGVPVADRRVRSRVEPPVLVTFEEVSLAVS